jgi:hypothetical protein
MNTANQPYKDLRVEYYSKKYAQEDKDTSFIGKATRYILQEFHYSLSDFEKDFGTAKLDNLFESLALCCNYNTDKNPKFVFHEKEGLKRIDEFFYPIMKNKRKNLLLRILS